jgi:hypothetical protein
MRTLYSIFLFLLFSISFKVSAQDIPYKAYVSAYGPFGQPYLRYQYADDILYSANSRFGVSATGATKVGNVTEEMLFDGNYDQYSYQIAPGGTVVLTINLTANGGGSIAYPGGKVIANFYGQGNPTSITGRIQKNDDTWYDITAWTNISLAAGYYVWQGTTPGNFNYCKTVEITMVNGGAAAIGIAEIEWVLNRPSYEPGLVTKFAANTLYKDLNWRGNTNILNAYIKPEGIAYFRDKIGINTITPTANLHVAGSSIITGNLQPGTLTIPAGAALGKVLTSDASGNATWQALSSVTGGWNLGGTTIGTGGEKFLGTLDNVALPIVTNNKVRMRVSSAGNIGIGDNVATVGTDYRLYVDGNIRTRKVRVDNNAWPDYVFMPGYSLLPIHQLEKFIRENKHLPEVPAAAIVHSEGIDLGDNQATLLKKIEELTLYIIDQHKKLEQQQQRIEALEKAIKK